MGRQVKKSELMSYVPVTFGERKRFESGEDPNPVIFVVHPLSPREWKRYSAQTALRRSGGGALDSPNSDAIERSIIVDNVKEIRNYTVGGEPIVTGEDLWERGENEFVEEILEVLPRLSQLQAGDLEQLSSRSGGDSQATPHSNGSVGPVSAMDSTSSETAPSGRTSSN